MHGQTDDVKAGKHDHWVTEETGNLVQSTAEVTCRPDMLKALSSSSSPGDG